MIRLILALILMMSFEQIAFAQIKLPLAPELIGHNLQPSYISVNAEGQNSNQARKITPMFPILGIDHGAQNNYDLVLGVVPLVQGGTGASTQQAACDQILNFSGLKPGSILYFNGSDWQPLAPGNDGWALSLVHGMPQWSAAVVGVPKSASIITLNESLSDYPNSAQLHVDPGCGITLEQSGGFATLKADSTVARTNQAQELRGPVTLSNGPSILGGHAQGLNFRCTEHTVNLSCADVIADRRVVIPDSMTDAEFLMSEGSQYVKGSKIFEDLALAGNVLKIGTANHVQIEVTIPTTRDSLVNCTTAQDLSNKSFVGLTIQNAPPFLDFQNSSGDIIINAANPQSTRHYQLRDANGDGDIAIEAGIPTAGGVAYGDGNLIRFTQSSGSGLCLVSSGNSPPAFSVLGVDGGGTGITTYSPGDLLTVDDSGKLKRLPIGKYGQVLTVNSKGMPYWK